MSRNKNFIVSSVILNNRQFTLQIWPLTLTFDLDHKLYAWLPLIFPISAYISKIFPPTTKINWYRIFRRHVSTLNYISARGYKNKSTISNLTSTVQEKILLPDILVLIRPLYDRYYGFRDLVKYRQFALHIWPLTLTFDLDT